MPKKLMKYPTAIWHRKSENRFYAFPLGEVQTPWAADDLVYPAIDAEDWTYKAAFPAGLEVKDEHQINGNKFECSLGGLQVYAPDWAWEHHANT